jgi:RNA polymerase sigma factor (sigma-70 family)
MVERASLDAQCRATIAALSDREHWGLPQHQIDAYAEQLLRQIPPAYLETQLEEIVRHYHANHRLVAALRDQQSVEHGDAWAWVEREITRVTQIKGLAWSKDRAVEMDDLVQTVQAEVVRVIGDFRYASSLRTWLQGVTTRRLHRYHRDSAAAKRAAVRSEPLEYAVELPVEWGDLEQQIMASVLAEEIGRILRTNGDARYAQIFHLRVLGDQSAEEIGSLVKLHPSRVRALLKLAREILRGDPGLRDWNRDDDEEGKQNMI